MYKKCFAFMLLVTGSQQYAMDKTRAELETVVIDNEFRNEPINYQTIQTSAVQLIARDISSMKDSLRTINTTANDAHACQSNRSVFFCKLFPLWLIAISTVLYVTKHL